MRDPRESMKASGNKRRNFKKDDKKKKGGKCKNKRMDSENHPKPKSYSIVKYSIVKYPRGSMTSNDFIIIESNPLLQ